MTEHEDGKIEEKKKEKKNKEKGQTEFRFGIDIRAATYAPLTGIGF